MAHCRFGHSVSGNGVLLTASLTDGTLRVWGDPPRLVPLLSGRLGALALAVGGGGGWATGCGMAQGYKNIIDKGIEVDAPLAIETSGHGAMKENYSTLAHAVHHEHRVCSRRAGTRVHGGLQCVTGVPRTSCGNGCCVQGTDGCLTCALLCVWCLPLFPLEPLFLVAPPLPLQPCFAPPVLDDGCYLAVKIIVEMVRLRAAGEERGIAALLDGLAEPLASHEFRLPFVDATDFGAQGVALLDDFPAFVAGTPGWTVDEPNYEGVRVSVDEGDGRAGWLLLRQSLHDPLLPLNIETETPGGVVATLRTLRDGFFAKHPNIDTSSLDEYEAAAPDRAVAPSTAAGA